MLIGLLLWEWLFCDLVVQRGILKNRCPIYTGQDAGHQEKLMEYLYNCSTPLPLKGSLFEFDLAQWKQARRVFFKPIMDDAQCSRQYGQYN